MDRLHPLVVQAARRRKRLYLTQTQVAALIGTTQSAVSELERGVTRPRIDVFDRYVHAVNMKLVLLEPLPRLPWRRTFHRVRIQSS